MLPDVSFTVAGTLEGESHRVAVELLRQLGQRAAHRGARARRDAAGDRRAPAGAQHVALRGLLQRDARGLGAGQAERDAGGQSERPADGRPPRRLRRWRPRSRWPPPWPRCSPRPRRAWRWGSAAVSTCARHTRLSACAKPSRGCSGERTPHRRAVDGGWTVRPPSCTRGRWAAPSAGRSWTGGWTVVELPRGSQPTHGRRRDGRGDRAGGDARGGRRRGRRGGLAGAAGGGRRDGGGVRGRRAAHGRRAAVPGRQLGVAGDHGRGARRRRGRRLRLRRRRLRRQRQGARPADDPVPERRPGARSWRTLLGSALKCGGAGRRRRRRLGVQARLRRLQQGSGGAVPRGDGRRRPAWGSATSCWAACASSIRARWRRSSGCCPATRGTPAGARTRWTSSSRRMRAQGSEAPMAAGAGAVLARFAALGLDADATGIWRPSWTPARGPASSAATPADPDGSGSQPEPRARRRRARRRHRPRAPARGGPAAVRS